MTTTRAWCWLYWRHPDPAIDLLHRRLLVASVQTWRYWHPYENGAVVDPFRELPMQEIADIARAACGVNSLPLYDGILYDGPSPWYRTPLNKLVLAAHEPADEIVMPDLDVLFFGACDSVWHESRAADFVGITYLRGHRGRPCQGLLLSRSARAARLALSDTFNPGTFPNAEAALGNARDLGLLTYQGMPERYAVRAGDWRGDDLPLGIHFHGSWMARALSDPSIARYLENIRASTG